MNLLESNAENFFETPAGTSVLVIALIAVLLLVIELNYRLFFKYVLDFIFALLATIVLSPVLLVCAVISKSRSDGGGIVEKKAYLGANGKIIYVHSFRNIKRLKNILRIYDVLCGKMSFVGIKLMDIGDGALISDDDMKRFGTRPGLVCHFVRRGYAEMTYEEMFDMDIAYCKKREMFGDIFRIFCALAAYVRGESNTYLGETAEKSYAQVLFECGEINDDDVRRANELADSAIENHFRTKEFKQDKNKRR